MKNTIYINAPDVKSFLLELGLVNSEKILSTVLSHDPLISFTKEETELKVNIQDKTIEIVKAILKIDYGALGETEIFPEASISDKINAFNNEWRKDTSLLFVDNNGISILKIEVPLALSTRISY